MGYRAICHSACLSICHMSSFCVRVMLLMATVARAVPWIYRTQSDIAYRIVFSWINVRKGLCLSMMRKTLLAAHMRRTNAGYTCMTGGVAQRWSIWVARAVP
jgi:hypothetical protein